MTKASDNLFAKVLLQTTVATAAPSGGTWRFEARANGLYAVSSNSSTFFGTGSLSDPMTTRGDIIVRNAANATDRLALGSNGTVAGASGVDVGYFTPPAFEFDYIEKGSSVSPTATTEGTADVVLTANAVTFDGSTSIWVEFFAETVRPTATAAATISLYLYLDGATTGRWSLITNPATATFGVPVLLRRRLTPASGSRQYSVRAAVSSGTGFVSGNPGGSGSTQPMYLRITRA